MAIKQNIRKSYNTCTYFLVILNVLSESRREPSIRDQVWIRHGIIRETVELVVNFGQSLLQAADESREWAKAIFVCTTTLDSCKGYDGVIEDPAYVCRFVRLRVAGEHLTNEIRSKRRQLLNKVGLLINQVNENRKRSETLIVTWAFGI